MRRIAILVLLSMGITSYALPRKEKEARQIAQKTINRAVEKCTINPLDKETGYTSVESNGFYIYNAKSGNGFVIISGDDQMPEVLGYSDSGNIDPENIPDNMMWLFEYYQKASEYTSTESQTETSQRKAATVPKHDIAPLVKTAWGQSAPYNKYCPELNSRKTLTGCVATAMAQVMYSLKWPQSETTSIPSYTTGHGIYMPELPPVKFDWDNMNDDDIAQLMLYCGQASKMNYGVAGSGASNEPEIYPNYFGYSKSVMRLMREHYNVDQWTDILYASLEKGVPIPYFGSCYGAHAFVVDGYADGMFHVNWGWDGSSDGYYHIYGLKGNGFDYSFNQEANLYLAKPAKESDENASKLIVTGLLGEPQTKQRNGGGDFEPFMYNWTFQSDLSDISSIELGLALSTLNGEIIQILCKTDCNTIFDSDSHTYSPEIIIEGNIPDGEYRIVPANKTKTSKQWYANIGTESFYADIKITDQTMEISPIPTGQHFETRFDFGDYEIDGIWYHLFYDSNYFGRVLESDEYQYKGALYIPDYITYEGKKYEVYQSSDFCHSNDLQSVSIATPRYPSFYNCASLESIEFRKGVSVLDGQYYMCGIHDCPKIHSLTFPSTCSEMNIVFNMESLESITFENNSNMKLLCGSKDEHWFENCPSLKDIYIKSHIPPIHAIAVVENFRYIYKEIDIRTNSFTRVHIPKGSKYSYLKSQWKDCNLIDDIELPNGDESVNWDYCGDLEDPIDAYSMNCYENNVEFAIKIPKEVLDNYIGKKISGMEFHTPADFYNDDHTFDAEYAFISKEDDKGYLKKTDISLVRGAWTNVKFEEPYIITGEDVFVGIGKKDELWIQCERCTNPKGNLYYRITGDLEIDNGELGKWKNTTGMYDDVYYDQAFAIRAIITGNDLPKDIMITGIRNEIVTGPSENPTIDIKVKNISTEAVHNITFNCVIDEKDIVELKSDTSISPNREEVVHLQFPCSLTSGRHKLRFNVSRIDNTPDKVNYNIIDEIDVNVEISENGVYNIFDTEKESGPTFIYDINGTSCSTRDEQLNDLPAGIYIVNGKKIMTK